MAVFKEEIHILEELAQRQKQIYPDACDIGVWATPGVKKQMHDIVAKLIKLPGSKLEWKMDNGRTKQYQYELIVMWGYADNDQYDATLVDVLYVKDRYNRKNYEYFSIDTRHIYTDANGERIK